MSQFSTGLAAAYLSLGALLLSGCTQLEKYDITVNDVTVYEPAPVIKVENVADTALRGCLQQTVWDHEATSPSALKILNCSEAGIQSLDGLEQFSALSSVKLSGNQIRNLLVLERLEALEQLWLDNNDIVDPIPVLRMTTLRSLNLTNNPALQCPKRSDIPTSLQLKLPSHCQST
jgi:hypothetical protein